MPKNVVIVGENEPPHIFIDEENSSYRITWINVSNLSTLGARQRMLDTARRKQADGILAASSHLLPQVSQVADSLGLSSSSTETVQLLNDRALLFERLESQNIPCSLYRSATSIDEAIDAGHELRAPVVIQATEAAEGAYGRFVPYIDDLSLAYRQITKHSPSRRVLLTRPHRGRHTSTFSYVHRGEVTLAGIVGTEAELPFLFPSIIYTPATLSSSDHELLTDTSRDVCHAIGFRQGVLRVDFGETDGKFEVIGVDPCPISLWMPDDLFALDGSTSLHESALRLAAGETPLPVVEPRQSAAIAWLRTRSGEVVGFEGIDVAESMADVVEVTVNPQLGEIMGHVVDQVTRDRVGYVVVTGADAAASIERATLARDTCKLITKTVYTN